MPGDTIATITRALKEIEASDAEGPLCASFRVAGQETPWIQVIPGILNLWWPFDEDPAARILRLLPETLPSLELGEWQAGSYATFDFELSDTQQLATAIDCLFRTLYKCPDGYELEVEVYLVQDEEIPDKIPIRREEGYHTDQIGRFHGGQFMGFVVATLPFPPPDDWRSHKRWYAVLHLFDHEGKHLKTDHWFAGTSADDEQSVVASAEQRLSEMLHQLGKKEYCDVQIMLFSIQLDEAEFGLVDATFEDEETGEVSVQAELRPNELVFYPPWDGTYDT